MPQGPGTAKKRYSPPSFEVLDASVAKAKLKGKGDPKDPSTDKMLSLIDGQLKKRKTKSRAQDLAKTEE
jgi:hypothetical protein